MSTVSTDTAELVHQFYRMRCSGSAVDMLSNEPLRRMLALCARVDANKERAPLATRDAKSRAANDID